MVLTNRSAFLTSSKEQARFVSPKDADIDLILAVEGCRTACADLSSFDGVKIRIINQSQDAVDFIQEMMG